MRNNFRFDINDIIAKAATEAGIRADEKHRAEILSTENGICEIALITEWNRVWCYADLRTGEILGIMGEVLAA